MEKIKVVLDDGAFLPYRAHPDDAGLDIRAMEFAMIPAKGSRVLDTGVHIAIPEGYAGMIKSRSGLNVNHCIQAEGVIDCGFTGSIKVRIYNHGDEAYEIDSGDKICQLVIQKIITPDTEIVDHLDETVRGNSAFGSTGR